MKCLKAGVSNRESGARTRRECGATALQFVVLFVPVFFGLIGFGVDLGMFYSAKSELKAAASAMALAAAQNLFGTDLSTDNATSAAQLAIENSSGFGNRYDFNRYPVGFTNE